MADDPRDNGDEGPEQQQPPEKDGEGVSEEGPEGSSDGSDPSDPSQKLIEFERSLRKETTRRFPSFCEADIDDVLQEVAAVLVQKLASNPGFLDEPGAYSYALRTAWNKGCDVLRRRGREDSEEGVGEDLPAGRYARWTELSSAARRECELRIREIAESLTPFQRFLWDAYVEHFPRSRRGKYLATVTGIPLEPGQLKWMIHEIRGIFLAELRDKGYDLDG